MNNSKKVTVLKKISTLSLLLMAVVLIPCSAIATDTTVPPATPPLAEVKSHAQPNAVENSTSAPLPSPTEAGKTEWCPLAIMLQEDHPQQELLKEFRNIVLTQHEKGKQYTRLYYLHSPEITLIILTNPNLKTQAQKVLSETLPIAEDLLRKGEAYLSETLLEEIDALLNQIAHKASPSLREVIKMAKSDIIKKDLFGELHITITN